MTPRGLRPQPRGSRRWPVLLGSFVVIAAAGAAGWSLGTLTRDGSPAAVRVAPDFRLPALDGRSVGLADHRGQVVLVEFWASWCGPCHLQAEILKPLYREFRPRGVEFLAVNLGEDDEAVRQFAASRGVPYPILVDSEERLGIELGIVALPTVLVIDRRGGISYLEPGISDGETLRRVLTEAGAGPSRRAL